jgi:putative FmdB family regulatory protein
MPVYEYRCSQCGELFEKWLRSMSGAEEIRCPRCGSAQVQKAVSLCGHSNSTSGAPAFDSSCAPTGG